MNKLKIVLVRHGKPISATNERCTPADFAAWVKRYKFSTIDENSQPDWQKIQALDNFYLVSSRLPRAQASAEIAFKQQPAENLACLNEMDIPHYALPFSLKAWTWVYLNRGLWMLGLKGNFESFKQAKVRAKESTHYLIGLAQQHNTVISVGHGFMHLYIRKYLKQQGWEVLEKDNNYWGISILTLNQERPVSTGG